MKTKYTLSLADSIKHTPEHPERTAIKHAGDGSLNFDVTYQIWPTRALMLRMLDKQGKDHAPKMTDWKECKA